MKKDDISNEDKLSEDFWIEFPFTSFRVKSGEIEGCGIKAIRISNGESDKQPEGCCIIMDLNGSFSILDVDSSSIISITKNDLKKCHLIFRGVFNLKNSIYGFFDFY